ncbi:hypothetical protein IW18_14085 [Flavobacterium hibernum]|uniref:Uncharacterized protein n=1 Tax=Flavobacterium hibernum TaxID=37752 RepID=A0A0D0EU31_9FLAO|nr:hypothetical protein IW18_14085 [Flavobacterium hibernum]OXA87094.1 hypothetical protein B0A73_12335 [Flavobacterium hibernum]STO14138.1 Uncharacterised protein [Flavobacterium hibernum]
MWNYFFLFVFFVFYAFISYKFGTFLISNFVVGFFLLLFLTYFYYKYTDRGLIMIFMTNLFFYFLLFLSSGFIYFDKENEKRIYYIFPILTSVLLMIVEKQTMNYDEAFWGIYMPVAGAFFPLYFLNYYKKYIREEV